MDRWARAKLDADRLLKADGFEDAEAGEYMRDPIGRTSSHGRDVPADVLAPLEAARRRDAAEYRAWAETVLRRWRFRSKAEREAWRRHAAGEGLRDIARAVGWTYHRTRTTVGAIRERAREVREVEGSHTKCRVSIGSLAKRCDLRVLAALAAGLLCRRQTRSPTSSS